MPQAPDRTNDSPSAGTELLSDVLGRVRLASAVFLAGEFSEPWAFRSTDEETLCAIVQPGAQHLVLFHVAVEGRFTITLDSGVTATVNAGDAVVLPYCDVHTMGWPKDTPAVAIASLVPPPPWAAMPVVRHGGGGAPTRILCGYLHCAELLFNPLLRALPPLIHVRPVSEQAAEWRQGSLRYALSQAQGQARPVPALVDRLPELVLVDCLRQYAEELPAGQAGWLGALRDPLLCRALTLLHAQPAHPWTVDTLANQVAASRSVLADRFTQVLGVSPIRYLTQWRMELAAQMLRTESHLGIAAIADRVGYESEAAFSRAFKRHVGCAPASWSRQGN
ncbi:MAG TPA: AraC family transcriptional regulator [Ramlibacter sp.]|uniref:AraC family transcriptional regulator n=1 Tax=Ramlibacter sp. TaxID=1917967 RepID=UPI002ED3BE18